MTNRFTKCYFEASDGLSLYFRDYAYESSRDNPPVVCLPGLTRNSRDFERIADRLSHSCRVICPDLRGRGESAYDLDWRNYHPLQYTDDVRQLLRQLEITHARLIGTSLGGMIAMLLADQCPDLVAAVVLNDIGPEIDPAGLARVVASAGTMQRVATFDDAVANTRANYEQAIPDWGEPNWHWFTETTYRRTDAGDYDLNYDRRIGDAVRAGIAGLPVEPWSVFDSLTDIPTLLVRGALSDVMTAEIAKNMQRRKPDLQMAVASNRGHAPILDESEVFDALIDFLARH